MGQIRIVGVAAVVLLSLQGSAHAAGKIIVTLGGKPVTEVPVDKLPDIQIKVTSGAPYKTAFKGQWGTLEHALEMYSKGSAGGGGASRIEYTGADKNWGSKKASAPKTDVALRQLNFFSYTSGTSVKLSVSYERQYYTGKMIVQGNGLVKEKAWQLAGEPLAETTITLLPPTFAATFDAKAMVAAAEADANVKGKRQYDESYAEAVARFILRTTTSSGTKVNFDGSTLKGITPDGTPVFNWNYVEGGGEYVTAVQPVKFALHGKNTIRHGEIPKPEIIEADFNCSGAGVSAKRMLDAGGKFAFNANELDTKLTQGCKTADGKSGADIAGTEKGPLAGTQEVLNNKTMTQEEKAAAVAKQLGFQLDPNAKDEETPAQKARRQQLQEMNGGH